MIVFQVTTLLDDLLASSDHRREVRWAHHLDLREHLIVSVDQRLNALDVGVELVSIQWEAVA